MCDAKVFGFRRFPLICLSVSEVRRTGWSPTAHFCRILTDPEIVRLEPFWLSVTEKSTALTFDGVIELEADVHELPFHVQYTNETALTLDTAAAPPAGRLFTVFIRLVPDFQYRTGCPLASVYVSELPSAAVSPCDPLKLSAKVSIVCRVAVFTMF